MFANELGEIFHFRRAAKRVVDVRCCTMLLFFGKAHGFELHQLNPRSFAWNFVSKS